MNLRHYYNEIDPYCVQWLRNLMDADLIDRGDIDTRSIEDVRPDDLRGYIQCHFFAGIGGWPLPLALAGWPTGRSVWTGSCPCQPFIDAGEGAGFADERHLWPAWQHLIAQCGPPDILGEQVSGKTAEPWVDLVHSDMEGMGYAFACMSFPASFVQAAHERQRVYWGAHSMRAGRQGHQPIQRISIAARAALSKFGDAFAHARRAMAGDYSGLCADHGLPVAVERLAAKGYGNAIVPQAAAEFIKAYAEACGLTFDQQVFAA